jgi:hypothetical protein
MGVAKPVGEKSLRNVVYTTLAVIVEMRVGRFCRERVNGAA